jgi:hypothetical protein
MVTRGLSAGAQLDRGVHAGAGSVRTSPQRRGLGRAGRSSPENSFVACAARSPSLSSPRYHRRQGHHAEGPHSRAARDSLKLVDHVAASIRRDAERDGRWRSMQLWVVSDHGHSAVGQHFDLAGELRKLGVKVRAHPWTLPDRSEVAVMVSGNSMAHLYVGLEATARQRACTEKCLGTAHRQCCRTRRLTLSPRCRASKVEVRRETQARRSPAPRGFSYQQAESARR